jgi:enoyl-CoA hydratase
LTTFSTEELAGVTVLQLHSQDGTNRLTCDVVRALTAAVERLQWQPKPLIITGNDKFFSAGADLNEIAGLRSDAFDFALMGQRLMRVIDDFPAPVGAAIHGYCMGGGLDLALACNFRVAHPHAIFGHRGASLGMVTGWGGTQRLPRLIGKGRAMQMFVAAEKLTAAKALEVGLVNAVIGDPIQLALNMIRDRN